MGLRILLVEDNPTAGLAVTMALEAAGFEVELVAFGGQVMQALYQQRADALLLDISLPDLDGIAVSNLVRERYPSMPIIFASGHGPSYPGLAAAKANPRTRVLQKPYEMADLTEAIRQLTRLPALNAAQDRSAVVRRSR